MITRITLKRLPLENLKRKPFRTAALVIVVMMLTLAFFGGSLLSMNPVSYTHLTLPTILLV